MHDQTRSPGPIVGNQQYSRGIRFVEDHDGSVVMTYVDNHHGAVFRSPTVSTNAFNNWSEALNYVTIWSILPHIKWW